MAEKYLIDTSAVIKYLNQTFSEKAIQFIDNILNTESNISFISEIELQAQKPTNEDDLLIYQEFVNASKIYGIDKEIISKTIEVRKDHRLKIADAIIAATALANNFTLIADNDKDYLKVPALKYLNPKNTPS